MSLLKWAGAGVVLVGLLVLGVAIRNKYFKQREIVIGSGLNRAAVYVPTDLVYSPTSQGTKVEMYSPDRTLNQYYYQTGGVQLWLAWNNPRTANIADIPMALASKTEVQAKMGQATIYIYPGAPKILNRLPVNLPALPVKLIPTPQIPLPTQARTTRQLPLLE